MKGIPLLVMQKPFLFAKKLHLFIHSFFISDLKEEARTQKGNKLPLLSLVLHRQVLIRYAIIYVPFGDCFDVMIVLILWMSVPVWIKFWFVVDFAWFGRVLAPWFTGEAISVIWVVYELIWYLFWFYVVSQEPICYGGSFMVLDGFLIGRLL